MREKTLHFLRSQLKSHGKEEDEEAQKRGMVKTAARLPGKHINKSNSVVGLGHSVVCIRTESILIHEMSACHSK